LKPWFGVSPPHRPYLWYISTISALLSLKLRLVVLWIFFFAMPQVGPKLDVPSGSYDSFSTPCWFLAFPVHKNCIACPMHNNWYTILKIVPKLLWHLHFSMQLVSLNLYPLWISYVFFTRNKCLRLVNRTSQISYLPQGVSTNLRWPRS
jgi:hypothetical protein